MTKSEQIRAFGRELQDLCNKYRFEIDSANAGEIVVSTSMTIGRSQRLKLVPDRDSAVWRVFNKGNFLKKPYVCPFYTCKGHGGEYELLGLSKPAGALRANDGDMVKVYRDVKTGALYHRMPECFDERMQKVDL